MHEIKYTEIEDFCDSNELCARIVGHTYNLDNIIENVNPPPIKKDGRGKYSAVGLQYKDPSDPFYDCVESIRFINDDHQSIIETDTFTNWNEWNIFGLMFPNLRYIENFSRIYRSRFLVAEPNSESVRHIDYDWRFHIPIKTNKMCMMHYDDCDIHLPADGHAYLINAGFVHSFSNYGTEDRWHFCGILPFKCEGEGRIDEVFSNHGSE